MTLGVHLKLSIFQITFIKILVANLFNRLYFLAAEEFYYHNMFWDSHEL